MSTYKLVFRGDIAQGHTFMSARKSLQELFRLDDQGLNKLFCGRSVTIKKNLDEATAIKWEALLFKAGAVVERVAEVSESSATSPETEQYSEEGTSISVEPPGADVLKPNERTEFEAAYVNTDGLSLDSPGADVLRPDERKEFKELDLDLSHISLAPENTQ